MTNMITEKLHGCNLVFAGLVLGASIVAGFSLIQEIIAGHSPLIPESHLALIYFGAVFGATTGYYYYEVKKLKKALAQNSLNQELFIPICANCKKVRAPEADSESKDSWQGVEAYISAKTAIQFSHTVCPECTGKLYGKKYIKN